MQTIIVRKVAGWWTDAGGGFFTIQEGCCENVKVILNFDNQEVPNPSGPGFIPIFPQLVNDLSLNFCDISGYDIGFFGPLDSRLTLNSVFCNTSLQQLEFDITICNWRSDSGIRFFLTADIWIVNFFLNDFVNLIPLSLTATPTPLDFGVVPVNTSSTLPITISNSSLLAVVLDLSFNNLCNGLSIVQVNPVTVPPGVSTIDVVFAPLTANTFVLCNLLFIVQGLNPSCPMLIVDIRGQSYENLTGCLPIAVAGIRDSNVYSGVGPGTPVSIEEGCCKEFCISISIPEEINCSVEDLTSYTIGTGFNVGLPLFNFNNNTVDFSITVCSDLGVNSELVILCGINTIVININNLVTIVPFPIIVTPAILDFGIVFINNTAILPVTVTNTSGVPINIVGDISGILCSGVTFSGGIDNFSIPANSSIVVSIEFLPTSPNINLDCILGFYLYKGCKVESIIKGRSIDGCTLDTIEINPKDCCEPQLVHQSVNCTSPFTHLHKAFALFYNCTDTNLTALNEKLRNAGLFGLFDKSKKAANDINDIHYLAMLLYMMWTEKVEDAMGKCGCCKFSKHPKYYIDKYNLQCVFDYFRCKNIDISCYLKAFKVDKVFNIYQLTHQTIGQNTLLWNINLGFLVAEQFADCPTINLLGCCIEGNGTYPSDSIYLHLQNYKECE